MKRNLDVYDIFPEEMRRYISNYGFHFSKKACDFAVSLMRRKSPATGKLEPIEPWSKEEVENLLKRNSVTLEHNTLYDFVYVANMCKADFYKSSIEDERHIALYVKDVIDDIDASNESTFRCWLAKMVGNGEPIEWYDFI